MSRTIDRVGDVYLNYYAQEYTVLEQVKNKCRVVFTDTGYELWALTSNVTSGKVKDVYHTAFYNVGAWGQPDKSMKYWMRAKTLWVNMLKRCYAVTAGTEADYYKDVSVDNRWLVFEYFLEDLSQLEGFDLWEQGEKVVLDKDMYGTGKLYSKEMCSFITQKMNTNMREVI